MSSDSNRVVDFCNARYNETLSRYDSEDGRSVVVSHFGEFTQDLVNSLSNGVEELMFESGDKKGTVKRIFSILVEGLQNIRIHGEKDEEGNQTSFIIISQSNDDYLLTISNLVFNKNRESIERRIQEINKNDQAQVKELYMEVLTNGIISSKGGAGLGFITMAMKSKNKLGYSIDEIDDNLSFFCLEVKLDRASKQ